MRLVYVFDAYCGWSHGFAPTLVEVARRHPELTVDVVSGGLFTGDRRVPVRQLGFVGAANQRISELTGAEFGDAYNALVGDGEFVMDSVDAARGVAALRSAAAPADMPRVAQALQRAFFVDGQSLSEPRTYAAVAAEAGLDPEEVTSAFQTGVSAEQAEADFRLAASLGAAEFPTLLLADGDRAVAIARGMATADQIDDRLTQARAALAAPPN